MTHFEDEPLLAPGALVLGRYRVVHFIARGGTGEVYVAQHRRLGHRVAIKVLHQHDAEDIARFVAEADAMAAVQHPGLVSIIDSGRVNELPCIVMNYIDGLPLDALLQTSAPIGWNDLLHLLVPTAEALGALHEHGFVHRDVKPANVVVQPGLRPGAVLIDLSIAVNTRVDGRLLPGEQDIHGTLAYMSPEQLRGEVVDARTDVFSFGLMLYECLVGKLPLARRNRHSSLRAMVRTASSPLPDVVNPRTEPPVPQPLRAIVRRCLQIHPEERYADGNELAEALNRVGPVAAFGTDGAQLPTLDSPDGVAHTPMPHDGLGTTLHPETRSPTIREDVPTGSTPPAGANVVRRPPRDRSAQSRRPDNTDWSRPLQGSGAFVIVPGSDPADHRSLAPEPRAHHDSAAETPAPYNDHTPAVAAALTMQWRRRAAKTSLRLHREAAPTEFALIGARVSCSKHSQTLLVEQLNRRAGTNAVTATNGDWWFALLSAGTEVVLHQRIHALLLLLHSATGLPRSAQWSRLECGPGDPGFAASVRDALRLIQHPSDAMPRIKA